MTQQEFFERYTFNVRTDKIGGGSFGTVYKAYDNVRDEPLAIKVAEVKQIGDKEFSLHDEFKAIGKLPDHANVAIYNHVYTFESPQGIYDYALMKFYPDGNLSHFLENNTTLTQEQRESICLGILDGIEHLHKHKVVHRDLKPGNILVHKRANGIIIPKITDFGLSKQAGTDLKASRFTNSFAGGTLMYSSPEQIKGQELRLNTDLWSFGAIAYEVLTGEQLFQVEGYSSASAEWQNQITQRILNQNIEERLEAVPAQWKKPLLACLQRSFNARVKSTAIIKELLQQEPVNQDNDTTEQNTGASNPTVIIGEKPPKKEPAPNNNPEPSAAALANKEQPVKPQPKQQPPKVETPKPDSKKPIEPGTKTYLKDNKKKQLLIAAAVLGGVVVSIFGFSYLSGSGQSDDSQAADLNIPVAFEDNGLYGYKIGDSITIPATYTNAGVFEQDKALVTDKDSTYFINNANEWMASYTANDSIQDSETSESTDVIADSGDTSSSTSNQEDNSSANNSNANNSNTPAAWTPKQDFVPMNELEAWVNANGLTAITTAAQNGNAIAARRLGRIYSNGKGVSENNQAAIKWYNIAVAKGDRIAQNNLGSIYYNGEGVAKDYSKAMDLFKKAYAQGNGFAARNLAVMYESGNGVTKNLTTAFEWNKKGADLGDAEATYRVGYAYYLGEGVAENNTQALKYFKIAAGKKHASANYFVGIMYDKGYGTAIDWNEAIDWYRAASNYGSSAGKRALGEFYVFGVGGVDQDMNRAKQLFRAAANAGNSIAQRYLKVIEDMENNTTYDLFESDYGNRLYLSKSEKSSISSSQPYVVKSGYGKGVGMEISYSLGRSNYVGGIWPASASETDPEDRIQNDDEIFFHRYSASSAMQDQRGSQRTSITFKADNGAGSRGIGYTYQRAYFQQPYEKLVLKIPALICWKPENEY